MATIIVKHRRSEKPMMVAMPASPGYIQALDRLTAIGNFGARSQLVEAAIASYAATRNFPLPPRLDNRASTIITD